MALETKSGEAFFLCVFFSAVFFPECFLICPLAFPGFSWLFLLCFLFFSMVFPGCFLFFPWFFHGFCPCFFLVLLELSCFYLFLPSGRPFLGD